MSFLNLSTTSVGIVNKFRNNLKVVDVNNHNNNKQPFLDLTMNKSKERDTSMNYDYVRRMKKKMMIMRKCSSPLTAATFYIHFDYYYYYYFVQLSQWNKLTVVIKPLSNIIIMELTLNRILNQNPPEKRMEWKYLDIVW